jgi:hypothetical protein
MHDHHKKISKNIKILTKKKTIEREDRLKYDIQNHVPAGINHTNVAFQSTSGNFIGVDCSRYMVSTFPFWHSPSYVLLKGENQ